MSLFTVLAAAGRAAPDPGGPMLPLVAPGRTLVAAFRAPGPARDPALEAAVPDAAAPMVTLALAVVVGLDPIGAERRLAAAVAAEVDAEPDAVPVVPLTDGLVRVEPVSPDAVVVGLVVEHDPAAELAPLVDGRGATPGIILVVVVVRVLDSVDPGARAPVIPPAAGLVVVDVVLEPVDGLVPAARTGAREVRVARGREAATPGLAAVPVLAVDVRDAVLPARAVVAEELPEAAGGRAVLAPDARDAPRYLHQPPILSSSQREGCVSEARLTPEHPSLQYLLDASDSPLDPTPGRRL